MLLHDERARRVRSPRATARAERHHTSRRPVSNHHLALVKSHPVSDHRSPSDGRLPPSEPRAIPSGTCPALAKEPLAAEKIIHTDQEGNCAGLPPVEIMKRSTKGLGVSAASAHPRRCRPLEKSAKTPSARMPSRRVQIARLQLRTSGQTSRRRRYPDTRPSDQRPRKSHACTAGAPAPAREAVAAIRSKFPCPVSPPATIQFGQVERQI